jgi:hypothetical protein
MFPDASKVILSPQADDVVESHLVFRVPVAASKPNIYNNMLTITVIRINGINTITHDTTV